jgi:hypothetical protein
MLLKGADNFWWHKRRPCQEGYEFKYINEIYQIVTYSYRDLMATGFLFSRAPPVARQERVGEIPAVGARARIR